MEDQLTIRLPRELSRALRRRAAQMQRKPSEVVRIAVREFLALIGSLNSGIPDLAIRHRDYIIKKLRRGR
jgi:predicted transcriptional regulator